MYSPFEDEGSKDFVSHFCGFIVSESRISICTLCEWTGFRSIAIIPSVCPPFNGHSAHSLSGGPVLIGEDEGTDLGVHDITGRITVVNPHGARIEMPEKSTGIEVEAVGK